MPFGELLGYYDIEPTIIPVDLQTAQTGLRVSLKNATWATIVVFKAAGTAGDDPTFDVQQADAKTGGNVKDLDIVDHYYLKDEATLDADETWSKVTQAAASEIADPGGGGVSAEHQEILVIEIDPAKMDLANNYRFLSLNCADVGGNAQLGCALIFLRRADPVSPASWAANA